MKLIVNLPAYNEAAKIGETIARIKKSFELDFYSKEGSVITEKLIQIVNDGSSDNTEEIARQAGANFIVNRPKKKIPRNTLGAAFKSGVDNALENNVDFFVNIDADGQFNPDDIPKLLIPVLDQTADMVIANRFGEKEAKNIPWIKDFLNRFVANLVGFFLGQKIDDLTCGFRALNRETLLRLNLTSIFTYTQESIIDAIGKNLKIKWVPVTVTYYADRKSKMTKSIWKFVSDSGKIILKAVRDVRPMKFFGVPGLIVVIASLLVFMLFLYHYFQTLQITTYRNYLFLSVILMFVGSQLLIFALIADMIKTNRNLTEEQMYLLKKDRLKK
ncbi:MAG: glycosyltransferase family 2 protein [Candidatus Moraniibacteriota bacterium]